MKIKRNTRNMDHRNTDRSMGRNFLFELNKEMFHEVLVFLEPSDILAILRTARYMMKMIDLELFWKKKVQYDNPLRKKPITTWKDMYRDDLFFRFGVGHQDIVVSNDGRTAKKTTNTRNKHTQMRTTTGFKKPGMYCFSLKADYCVLGGFGFGIITKDWDLQSASFVSKASSKHGFAYYNNGFITTKGENGQNYAAGDIVSCIVDTNEGTIEFLLNAESQGIMYFEQLKNPAEEYFPFVNLFSPDFQFTLLRVTVKTI